jgi:hypothetical protein
VVVGFPAPPPPFPINPPFNPYLYAFLPSGWSHISFPDLPVRDPHPFLEHLCWMFIFCANRVICYSWELEPVLAVVMVNRFFLSLFGNNLEVGYRLLCLVHAKHAVFHLSYIPTWIYSFLTWLKITAPDDWWRSTGTAHGHRTATARTPQARARATGHRKRVQELLLLLFFWYQRLWCSPGPAGAIFFIKKSFGAKICATQELNPDLKLGKLQCWPLHQWRLRNVGAHVPQLNTHILECSVLRSVLRWVPISREQHVKKDVLRVIYFWVTCVICWLIFLYK